MSDFFSRILPFKDMVLNLGCALEIAFSFEITNSNASFLLNLKNKTKKCH